MSAMPSEIAFGSDNSLLLKGPTSQIDPSAIAALQGATVTGRLFNADVRSQVVVDAAADSNEVIVKSVEGFVDGMNISGRLSDRGWHVTTVASIDASSGSDCAQAKGDNTMQQTNNRFFPLLTIR